MGFIKHFSDGLPFQEGPKDGASRMKPAVKEYKNPSLAADAIVLRGTLPYTEVLLIKRKNPPYGWAFPGGFVDYGEAVETAVLRELKEETDLDGRIHHLVCVASKPDRDPRQHVVSIVYLVQVARDAVAKPLDDAIDCQWWPLLHLPQMAFDHKEILNKHFGYLKEEWL